MLIAQQLKTFPVPKLFKRICNKPEVKF